MMLSLLSMMLSLRSSISSMLVAAAIALPGGQPVGMDYLAIDCVNDRLWVPSGNTGAVNVIDVSTGKLRTLEASPPDPRRVPDAPRWARARWRSRARPSGWGTAATTGSAPSTPKTLARGACVKLASMPDGLAFIAGTHELWATTPRDQTLTIVNTNVDTKGATKGAASAPSTVRLEGAPEGYAVDEQRARFYTNLEDKDRTLAIDVKTRKVVASWPTGCGAEGPRGLVLDPKRQLLFSACTDGAVVLDVAHDGAVVGRLKTGAGVDNLDYDATRALLFVASASDGNLTIARVGKTGR